MKISYSVVVYNNSINQVNDLIKNIINTIPDEFEYYIYIINNNPKDSIFIKESKKFESEYKNVMFLYPVRNLGFGSGNNLGILRAQSDYHIILNPDVIIPNKQQIKNMISYMELNDIILLSPQIKYPNGKIQHLVKRAPSILDMGLRFMRTSHFKKRQDWFVYLPDGYNEIHHADNYPGSFLVAKTSELQKIGGFDEKIFMYMEDTDICRTMGKVGKTVFYPDAFIYHEWQRSNVKNLKSIFQMIRSMIYFFNKWGWKVY